MSSILPIDFFIFSDFNRITLPLVYKSIYVPWGGPGPAV